MCVLYIHTRTRTHTDRPYFTCIHYIIYTYWLVNVFITASHQLGHVIIPNKQITAGCAG